MQKEEKKRESSVSPLALIAGALVLIALVTLAFLRNKESQWKTSALRASKTEPAPQAEPQSAAPQQDNSDSDFRMPPFLQPVELSNLPPTKDPMTVIPGARTAYQVAEQKPKLLAQIPCFCYCDRFGHGSLHDCFVSDHAQSCDICLKEALQADQLDERGMSANQIRDVIVAQFHPREQEHSH
jgi:Protein of unknown function with PCYCGC motif